MVTINIGERFPRRRRRYRRNFRRNVGRRGYRFSRPSVSSRTPDTGYVPTGNLAWNPINFPDLWAPGGNIPSGIHQVYSPAGIFE